MEAPRLRVADVLRDCWKSFNCEHRLPPHVAKAVRSILACRTEKLGGHIHECDHCGSQLPVYNGCQTRHCPSCQAKALEYLTRYSHKVAISDSRIKSIDNGSVTYTWRDRADNNTEKPDTITTEEFTKRFCTHILPERFHKIRYGGWMSAARRKKILPAIREAIGQPPPEQPSQENETPVAELNRTVCPNCDKGHLHKTDILIMPRKARPPP